jgi:hypothetical protein
MTDKTSPSREPDIVIMHGDSRIIIDAKLHDTNLRFYHSGDVLGHSGHGKHVPFFTLTKRQHFIGQIMMVTRRYGMHSSPSAPLKIALPPGTTFSRVLRAVLTRGAYRQYVLVAVTEMQAEYIEEYAAGHKGKALWVVVRGHFLIIWPSLRALCPKAVRKLF